MPLYLFWGDDEFRLQQAVQSLITQVVDPAWASFNYDRLEGGTGSSVEGFIQGLNQAMTPSFGAGQRLVWLVNPPLTGQQESSVFREELERTLPALPETTHLLLTYSGKPDGRSKMTKYLYEQAQVKEFSLVPPWKTDAIRQIVQQTAQQLKVTLTRDAADLLVDAVGNDTRQLVSELEKLKLYVGESAAKTRIPIERIQVEALISTTQQNSLVLANTIRQGLTDQSLGLISDLLSHNEPPLKISATLIRQFRTWLWIKLLQNAGERDERVIAKAADIANPKRLYFLSQDVATVTQDQLKRSLILLLDLDAALKQGQDPTGTLQTKIIELCQVCRLSPYP